MQSIDTFINYYILSFIVHFIAVYLLFRVEKVVIEPLYVFLKSFLHFFNINLIFVIPFLVIYHDFYIVFILFAHIVMLCSYSYVVIDKYNLTF